MGETRYLFGDGDLAARRLELLARVFEEPTRAFLLKRRTWLVGAYVSPNTGNAYGVITHGGG